MVVESYALRGELTGLNGYLENACEIREMMKEQYDELDRLAKLRGIDFRNRMVFPEERPHTTNDEGDWFIYGVLLTDRDFDAERYLVVSNREFPDWHSRATDHEEELRVVSTADGWMYRPESVTHYPHALYTL